jgi:hypothetical protein
MRRILFAVALSAAVIATVRAQTMGSDPTRLFTIHSDLSKQLEAYSTPWFDDQFTEKPLGRIDGNGEIFIPAAIFEGAATLSVVEKRCKAEPNRRSLLLPTSRAGVDALDKKLISSSICGGDCSCTPLRRMRFREDYNYDWTVRPFYSRPEFLIPAAGGTIGGIIFLTKGGPDGEDGGNSNPNNPGSLLGSYDFNGIVQQRGACNFIDFRSIVEFSGSESSFSARLAESGGTFPFTGTATFTSERIQFNTSTNITIAGLGNAVATFVGQILSNRTATGTQTMNFPCGTVTVAQSGTRR